MAPERWPVSYLGIGDGQGGLACCGSWGHKESDTTERLNWTELNCTDMDGGGWDPRICAKMTLMGRIGVSVTLRGDWKNKKRYKHYLQQRLPWWLLPAMQETWVWSLGREDPLEKEMATHSSILAWRIPWTGEPGKLWSMGLQRVGHDWVTISYL